MPEIATQQIQLQVITEATPGTILPATKQLRLATFEYGPAPEFKEFPGMGRRLLANTALNKNKTVAKIGGPANYTEMIYWAAAMWGVQAITTPVGATLARKHTWDVSLSAAITQKTLSVERGSAVRAQKFAYGIMTDIGEKLGRDDCTLEGALIGQPVTDSITLTGSPTIIPGIEIVGQHNNYYYDTTSGGLGVTKLTRVWDASWQWNKAVQELYPQDRATNSYPATVDLDPDTEIYLLVSADAQGWGMYADAIANATRYVRIESQGDLIESGSPNQFYLRTLDAAVRIVNCDVLKDEKGIQAFGFHMRFVDDPVWGHAMIYSLVNTQTAP